MIACCVWLPDQFAAAELSVYENKWAEVFDFTAAGGRHFTLMSQVRHVWHPCTRVLRKQYSGLTLCLASLSGCCSAG